MPNFNFTYKSVVESEDRMYNDIKDVLDNQGVLERLSNDLMLAVSEAFTNALVHANKNDSTKEIRVSISINDDIVRADIIDEGFGDPDAVCHQESPDLWQDGGRGVILMKQVSDELEFCRNRQTGGLHVTVIFKVKRYLNSNKTIET